VPDPAGAKARRLGGGYVPPGLSYICVYPLRRGVKRERPLSPYTERECV